MTEKFLTELLGYVEFNAPLNLDENIKEYIKSFGSLYRLWHYSIEDSKHPITIPSSFPFLACTRSISALTKLAIEADSDPDSIVTEHFGRGIDPIRLLRIGLQQYPNFKRKDEVLYTIKHYEWQKEILLLDVPNQISIDDVVAIWTGESLEDVN